MSVPGKSGPIDGIRSGITSNSLIEAMPDGFLVVERTGTILLANKQAGKMFGYTPEELVGLSVDMLVPEAARSAHPGLREGFIFAPKARIMGSGLKLCGLRKDGSEIPLEISLSLLDSSSDSPTIAVVRDATVIREAEAKARAVEEQFRLMVESVHDYAIFQLTPEGVVATWNPGAEKIKGYKAEDIIGQHFSRFYRQEEIDSEKPDFELRLAVAIGRYEEEGWRVRKDGSEFYASVIITPLRSDANEVAGFVKVTRDITESKAAEEAVRKANLELQQFFSASVDLLCISSPDGFFTRVSPSFTRVLGWSEEELLSRPYFEFVHPDDFEQTVATVGRYLQQGEPVAHFVARSLHKDGSYRVLSWNSVPHVDGVLYGVARDITEQHRLESLLVEAKEEAEKANHAKSEFLSRMSHELRTPMNSVLGYAQLLELQYTEPDIQGAARAILKSGRHLLEMINEVLDLSRIESGTLTVSLEPVSLADIVDQAVSLVRPLADAASITLLPESKVPPSLLVLADRQRLLQVLINLLGNAVKYNRKGGRVVMRLAEPSDSRVRLEISDTGLGISAKNQELLFQPFQRFGNNEVEGTGLGLALSMRFAKLMEGALGLSESSDEGSTFFLELKSVDSKEAGTTPKFRDVSQISSQRLMSGTVLYVEDNPSNMSLIQSVFTKFPNLKLIPAMQGLVGLDLARQHRPNLILLDLHLPDASGADILLKLRADPATEDIPVVVLSADATKKQIDALLSQGAADYLTKPVDLQELFRVLGKHLHEGSN